MIRTILRSPFMLADAINDWKCKKARQSYRWYVTLKVGRILFLPVTLILNTLFLAFCLTILAVNGVWQGLKWAIPAIPEHFRLNVFDKSYFGRFSHAYWQGLRDGATIVPTPSRNLQYNELPDIIGYDEDEYGT